MTCSKWTIIGVPSGSAGAVRPGRPVLEAAVVFAGPQVELVDLQAILEFLGRLGLREADELRQPLHLPRQEIALGRAPGAVGQGLVIDEFGEGPRRGGDGGDGWCSQGTPFQALGAECGSPEAAGSKGSPQSSHRAGRGSAGVPAMRASSSRMAARKPAAKSSAGGAISARWRRASAGKALASAMAWRAFLAWSWRSRFLGWRGLRAAS